SSEPGCKPIPSLTRGVPAVRSTTSVGTARVSKRINWRPSSRLPPARPLPMRLEQRNSTRDRGVERPRLPRERDAREAVAVLADVRPQPLALRADDDDRRPGEIDLRELVGALAGEPRHPRPRLLELLQRAREVHDLRERHALE